MKRAFSVLLVVISFFLLLVETCLAYRPLQQPIWEITSPLASAQLRGTVQITGSAFLGADFDSYTLEYAPASDPQAWVVFDESETQIRDGLLGIWDTTLVPDGLYILRLRVVRENGSYEETSMRQVVVANYQPMPTPTPTGTATPLPLVFGTPTVVVVQSTSAPAAGTPGAGFPERVSLPGVSGLVRSFVFGILVAGVFLGLLVLLGLLRRFA